MGSRVNSEVVCPGCKMKTQVGFRYPGVFDATVFNYECTACKSLVMVRATRPKDWAQCRRPGPMPAVNAQLQRQVEFSVKIIKPSQLLVQLLREEAEHNAKPVDQVDAEAGA